MRKTKQVQIPFSQPKSHVSNISHLCQVFPIVVAPSFLLICNCLSTEKFLCIDWMELNQRTCVGFPNVQNRKFYQARSEGGDEPDLEMMRKNGNYSFTWLAPALGKVSQISIGKRRDESCLCISLNLASLCYDIVFILVMEGKYLLIPTIIRHSSEIGSTVIPCVKKDNNFRSSSIEIQMRYCPTQCQKGCGCLKLSDRC